MAVNVEYIIKLNDQLTAKLKAAQAQVEKLNGKVNDTQSKFSGLGSLLGKVGGAIAIGAAAKSIVTLGANMEQTRIAFSTFIGDADRANKLIDQLNEFANVTPFNNEEIIKSGRLLLAAGIPAEQVTAQLKQIGDVAAGANVPIEELAAIFQKATNKGKLQAEELNQFSERGIPLLDALAKKFGVTKAEVLKLGEQGKITSQVMNQAFTDMTSEGGMFFNLMEKQSQSLGGRFSTLIGKAQMLGIKIGEALIPILGPITEFAIGVIEGGDALQDLLIVVGAAVTIWTALNAQLIIATIQTKIYTVAQWDLNAALSANPIGLVVAAIVALIAAIVLAWKHSETFRGVILGLWESIKVIGTNIFKMLVEPLISFGEIIKAIINLDFNALMDGLKKIGKSLLSFILSPILLILKGFDAIAGTDFADKLKNVTGIADATEGVGKAFGKGFAEGKKKEEKDASVLGTTTTVKSKTSGITSTTGTGTLNAGVTDVKAAAPKTFNINIEKLIEGFEIKTTNLTDSASRIKEEVQKALILAITDASIISE